MKAKKKEGKPRNGNRNGMSEKKLKGDGDEIKGERTVDSRTREEARARRLYIDYLASAGIDSGRLSVESLFMLPTEFVHAYSTLFHEALIGIDKGKSQGNRLDADAAVLTPGIQKYRGKRAMIGNRSAGKVVNGHWLIRDEMAFEIKEKIDRKLVGLVREVGQERSLRRGGRQCGGESCRSFLKDDWRFCPQCGADNGRM